MKALTTYLKGGLIAALILSTRIVKAQSKIDPGVAKFFVGQWEGKGQFANGKAVEADVTYYLSPDSCHLIYVYADRLPNRYKAAADWTIAPTGTVTANIINNFTGLTDFHGVGQNGHLAILSKINQRDKGILYQSFIYDRVDADHFKVSYVYGRDSSQMKEGDHLIFSRIRPN